MFLSSFIFIKHCDYNKSKEVVMTNEEAIEALKQIKTYTAASLLDEIDYVIKVMEKLEKDGVSEPLKTDFTKLSKEN